MAATAAQQQVLFTGPTGNRYVRVRAQPGNGVVDRHPGFVAAGFDAENAHDSGMAGRRWESRLSGQISHLDLHRAGAGAYHTRLARDLGRKSEFRSIHA